MEPANRYGQYELLEANILSKIEELSEAHFGGREVNYGEKDPRAQEITRVVNELIQDFPSDDRGNRFIGCSLVIQPIIIVPIADVKPILPETNVTHLFQQEMGKMIKLVSFATDQLGTLYSENNLELRNIRVIPGQKLHQLIEGEKEKSQSESQIVCKGVNLNSTHGVQETPGRIKMVADMKFGEHANADFEFEAEIGDTTSTVKYHLPLPPIVGKIQYDRFVQLSNGKEGKLEDFGVNVFGGGANIKSPFIIRFNVLLT
jgi:hypothetical protein